MPVQTATQRFQELAASPLPVSAMPLRVAAAPFLSANGNSRVAVVLEMPPEGLRPTDEDERISLKVDVSIGLYDRDGRSVGSDDPTIELNFPLGRGRRATARGVRIVSRIEAPPGTLSPLGGAVQSPSDVRGSVMTEIHVPDFAKEPLALSGIAVATSGARRMLTTRTDELLDDVLGAPPVAHREFLVGRRPLDLRRDLRSSLGRRRGDGERHREVGDGKTVDRDPVRAGAGAVRPSRAHSAQRARPGPVRRDDRSAFGDAEAGLGHPHRGVHSEMKLAPALVDRALVGPALARAGGVAARRCPAAHAGVSRRLRETLPA